MSSILHKHILIDTTSKRYYYYSPVMIELLHLVADVPRPILEQTKIYSRSPERYIPFYPAHKGGGAITLGSDTWQSITFTENFFSTDQERFSGRAYADDLQGWLQMSAHEAGHLLHAERFQFFLIYLIMFAYQYLRYGHDAAPLEIEANHGTDNLRNFQGHLNRNYGLGTLAGLITDPKPEAEKISQLQKFWSEFISTRENKPRA